MTLAEKLGQLQLVNTADLAESACRDGPSRRRLQRHRTRSELNELQHFAVNQTRLGIPLIFGLDVIHGYVTNFPIPLAQASSFDPTVAYTDATIAAAEARRERPALDVRADDGRHATSRAGDASPRATAKTLTSQANSPSRRRRASRATTTRTRTSSPRARSTTSRTAQPEGGRDYNTVDVSIQRLHNFYLPPFKAAVEAGVATVMTAFNTISGVPAHGNVYMVRDVLKGTYGFDGFVVSDYTGIEELITHGLAGERRATRRATAITAGVDMEMVSTNYVDLRRAAARRGTDHAARRSRTPSAASCASSSASACSTTRTSTRASAVTTISPANAKATRQVAAKSMVLLKNNEVPGSPVLPLGDDVKHSRADRSARPGHHRPQRVLGRSRPGARRRCRSSRG